jgi:hypothetical protein
MIASEEQIAAAREAIALGEQIAMQYHEAGAANPGVGLAVSLPSVSIPSLPPVQGLGFDLPPDVPALRKPEQPLRLVPDYGSPAIGGMLHHTSQPGASSGLDGVSWPSGQTQSSSVASRTNSVVYVGPSQAQPTWRSRLREAWSALLGR